MRIQYFCTAILLVTTYCGGAELTREQELIVACHRLDVDTVVGALRNGADANGRFGDGDAKLFQDPWTLGWPGAAAKWTPLIAVASASDYPPPPNVKNAPGEVNTPPEDRKKIPLEKIEQRKRDALTIARILLSSRADIDADDGYGATALYKAVYLKKPEVAKLLVQFNAKVNTKTGIYIDGDGDITPLHRAYWSAELTKLLLEKGADPKAKDTSGRTPRDWSIHSDDPAVAKLYQLP